MAEYIEREALLREIERRERLMVGDKTISVDALKRFILNRPAADVAPVVHGRWDDSGRYTFPSGSTAVRCTNCGCALTVSEYRLNNWNYCPVCGAKMDGGDSDEAD